MKIRPTIVPEVSMWTSQPMQQQAQQAAPETTDPPAGADGKPPAGPPAGDGKTQNPSGEGKPAAGGKTGESAEDFKTRFEAQQKVNRDLETKLNGLRDGLKNALGVEDKKADIGDLVGSLQQQLDSMKHNSLVDSVARSHGIADDTDIEFLRSAKDRDAMTKLAERLKPSAEQQHASGKPRTPKPDPSAGRGGDGARASSVAQVMADRAAAREAKTTKTKN